MSSTIGTLTEKSDLKSCASGSTKIFGSINAAKPVNNQRQQPIPKVVEEAMNGNGPGAASPAPPSINAKNRSPSVESSGSSQKKSQISTVAVFAGEKKRIILKRNPKKGTDEYTMDSMREKIRKKFKTKGLQGHFTLKLTNGQDIQTDQDVQQLHLTKYEGEILVQT